MEELGEIKKLWEKVEEQLSEKGYAENWVHGIPHIGRVWENLKILLKRCSFEETVEKCLKVAVLVHDIGRVLPGDHAKNSADIFKRMRSDLAEDFLTAKEFKDILFAIENHSRGLAGLKIAKAKNDKEILLGLLVLLDHMDAIGKIGFYRTLEWSKDTGRNLSLLSEINPEKLKGFIKIGNLTSEIKKLNLKEESILAHLLYNILVTERIVQPVKHLLNPKFLKEVRNRKNKLLEEVKEMIKLMEENKKLLNL